MKKRAAASILGSVALVGTLIFNPYSFDFSKDKVSQSKVSASAPYNRDVLYLSNEEPGKVEGIVSGFESNQKQKIKDAMKVTVKKDDSIPSLDGYEDVVVHVDKLKKDIKLQKELQGKIKSGTKVYLVGGASVNDFKNLLKLDKIEVKDKEKNKTARYDWDEEKMAKEKGPLKVNPNSAAEEGEFNYDVIGYTLDENENNQLMISNISAFDENGKKVKPTDELYVQEVLGSTAETVDVEEQEYAAAQKAKQKVLGFLTTSKVEAGMTGVKSSPARIYGNAYYSGTKVGHTVTDWYLSKASDSESAYDYFMVEDKTSVYQDSSIWEPTKLWADHDIPYDSDYIKDWDPDDDGDSPYQIGFGLPYSMSWGFEMTGDPIVDNIGSQQYDYGRWEVTETNWGLSGLDGERFQPTTTWKSAGTWAVMDIREKGTFQRSGLTATSSISVRVSYDY
ncbi:hypothetical protein [Neobacillus niacini]|uniref:hypothetical protein n=1 Tax=Neobacillus niacini TaxID=86668 RepID=UPI0028621FDE|nr:hypothetical protein [Neobacillus niacini]MDR7003095.1 hypothetical protein [Neobacillus niacini]